MWRPAPIAGERLMFYKETLLPQVAHPAMQLSCAVRGKDPHEYTKAQLVGMLAEDMVLEKRVLGERTHRGCCCPIASAPQGA